MTESEPGGQEGESGPSREEFLRFATEFAEMVQGKGNIQRIGLFGSIARVEERPGDVDLILLISPEAYRAYIKKTTFGAELPASKAHMHILNLILKTGARSKDANFLFEDVLGLKRNEAYQVCRKIVEEYPFDTDEYPHSEERIPRYFPDIILMPDRFSPELSLQMVVEHDPTFYSTIARDYQEFNSQKGGFEPKSLYSEQDMKRLNAQEFERLKMLVQNPDMPVNHGFGEH